VASLLLAGCATPPLDSPRHDGDRTLWIVNGVVYGNPGKTAVRIEGSRIAAVTNDRAPAGAPDVIDAKGGLVLPGFNDAHVHLLEAGLAKAGADVSDCETLDAAVRSVKRFADAHPDAPWIVGGGWQYGIVARGAFPSRRDLDAVVPDRPVFLRSYDGHTAWANSKALALAGIEAGTADPASGKIVREADGRTPQGTLLEDATDLVERKIPPPSRPAKLAALETALADLARFGVTSIDDIEADPEVLDLLDELEARGALKVRVVVGLPLEGDLDAYEALRKKHSGALVRFGFLKGFVDGVVESRTAFLLEPYEGSTERGSPRIAPQRLKELVERAHARGFRVALHAIGDAAVRMSLDAIEHAVRRHPEIELHHRIEHIEVLDAKDARRFAQLGAVASMQPYHALPEPETAPWSSNLGKKRLPRTFAWRELLDAGATLAFGSDWPVASASPLFGLAVAVTRRDPDGQPPGGWNAGQAITIDEAMRAYACGSRDDGGELGKIEVGRPADLVVLSPEVRLEQPATLWKGRVEATVMNGRPR
jgi:predicted amidohydrolase YtcJ